MSTAATLATSDDCELIEHLPFTTETVIGARARIGVVVLATDYTLEHEFRAILTIPGVDVYQARIRNTPTITPASLAAMEPPSTSFQPGNSISQSMLEYAAGVPDPSPE